MAEAALVPIRLSCATANLNGKNSGPDRKEKPSQVRYEKSKDLFESTEVLFLQEVTFKRLINKHYKVSHHIYIQNSVGILISKQLFDIEKTLFGSSIQGDIDAVNRGQSVKLDSGRVICVTSIHKVTGCCLLFVSYHGQHTGKTSEQKANLCKMLMALCTRIKERENAEFLVIGGDFNLDYQIFQCVDRVLQDFTSYKAFEPNRNDIQHIDYFVCDHDINHESVDVAFIPVGDDKAYFDHAPITATLDFPYFPPENLEIKRSITEEGKVRFKVDHNDFTLDVKVNPAMEQGQRALCKEMTRMVRAHIRRDEE